MKIGIGTAQFGLDYGISNIEGKTSFEEAKRILKLATQEGVKIIDTAPAYGDSEEVIGNILSEMNYNFSIITKTPHFHDKIINNEDVKLLEQTFYNSLTKLKQDSIYGLLFHNADDLLKPNSQLLMNKILELKHNNQIQKIGVSVYNSKQIDAILDKYSIDLIQLPINIFDQRLIQSGHLKKLKDKGIEIHARSIFLQGLLLMDIKCLSPFFDSIKTHLNNYENFIQDHNFTKVQSAINFVQKIKEISNFVIGLNNVEQFKDLLISYQLDQNINLNLNDYIRFSLNNLDVIEPFRWKIK